MRWWHNRDKLALLAFHLARCGYKGEEVARAIAVPQEYQVHYAEAELLRAINNARSIPIRARLNAQYGQLRDYGVSKQEITNAMKTLMAWGCLDQDDYQEVETMVWELENG